MMCVCCAFVQHVIQGRGNERAERVERAPGVCVLVCMMCVCVRVLCACVQHVIQGRGNELAERVERAPGVCVLVCMMCVLCSISTISSVQCGLTWCRHTQ